MLLQQRIEAPGGAVEFAVAGDGPPILYFHGTPCGCELTLEMEQSLVDDGFQLIILNRPGFYGTPLAGRTTTVDCAKLAAHVLDHLKIEHVAVMGTSAGGPPALAFAAGHQSRTVALVLQCAQVHRWDDSRWAPASKTWLYRLLRYPTARRLFCECFPILFRIGFPTTRAYLKDLTGPRFGELPIDEATWSLAKSLHRTVRRFSVHRKGYYNDITTWFSEDVLCEFAITVPTLLLYDPLDPQVPLCHAEYALEMIPGAQLVSLHAGGHLLGLGRDGQRMHATRVEFLREHLRGGNSSATHDNTHAA
jgi:pimeloyl-ACP methyl ester carboxylesterase